MTRTLHVAKGFSLPREAVTETFGILAVRGAGKSNAAATMAEEMFALSLPFVVIDPVRAWWGLRSSRSGHGPGLAIPIFGGRRGDVPLERNAGAMMADLVADERLSCVLDVSEFESEGAKKQFLLDFATRLYRKNEAPLHLFLEEADDYIPQRPMREEAQLLRAWENIVRRGRNRGLGVTLITQRSAAINKNVLTQVQTLIAMRTTGPQDRAAIEEWLKYNNQEQKILASLPSLKDGEAWVWSPHFLEQTVKIQFRLRHTFDSGATPKVTGTARPVATLADVDLKAIRGRMAATIEKAKADDPRELRRQLAEANVTLARERRVKAEPLSRGRETRVNVPVLKDTQIKRLEKFLVKLTAEAERHGKAMSLFWGHHEEQAKALLQVLITVSKGPVTPTLSPMPSRLKLVPPSPRQGKGPVGDSLDASEQRILDTIAMLNVRGLDANRESIARWQDLHPTGGRYGTNLAHLRSAGYLSGCVLTEQGQLLARRQETGLDAALRALQDDSRRRIVQTLVDAGHPLSREELAGKLGLHPTGGRFGTNLGWLRTMGIITARGPIEPTKGLFQ